MPHPKGYSALRRGRFSVPSQLYFVTICVDQRRPILTDPDASNRIQEEIDRMTADGAWRLRALTIMPDHLHLFAELGARLSLSQAVGRLKAKTKPALAAQAAQWQENFFEHRVTSGEPLLPVLLYIYLNPYRKGLISPSERWPWFCCSDDDWSWFKDYLNADLPEPAWLQ